MSDELNQTTETTIETTDSTGKTGVLTQAEVDKQIGNARKKARDTARKELLKELGLDPDDPKAVEAVKSKLTLAQQAEEAQRQAEDAAKTELQKVQERIAQAEKERDEAKQLAAQIEAKRKADKLDSRLQALATADRAIDPADVVSWLRTNKSADVEALMDENEGIDEAKAKSLLEEVRKAKGHWFKGAQGAGSPSLTGGQTPGMDDTDARDKHWREYRRQA